MTKIDSESAEILERLRRQIAGVRQDKISNVTAGSRAAAPFQPSTPSPSLDLSSLRLEVETATTGHRDSGQINPRPPGVANSLIQFHKKVMRRSLTWYTRPIHVFQAAVIRALQEIIRALEAQREDLHQQREDLHQQREDLYAQREDLHKIKGDAEDLYLTKRDANVRQEATLRTIDEFRKEVAENLRILDGKIHPMQTQIQAQMQPQIDGLKGTVGALRAELAAEKAETLDLIRRQRSRERDVRRLVYAVEGNSSKSAEVEASTRAGNPPSRGSNEFDYFSFEDRYRGDEKLIHDRQREYIEYFRGRSDVVDIGCGRGEFLELMRDNGISARGVELGLDQFLLCREKGLDVVQEDLFTFLESQPDESLGGLFSAQVIEHLSAQDQLRYVALAYQKTSPGSPVIFETINALSLYAVLNNYLLDPTHVRLVHPKLLEFAMQSAKFRDVQLKFMAPVGEYRIPSLQLGNVVATNLADFNDGIAHLNELIYGPQDFAAIGWH
jgi:2-polyprenyl-3-methyl-5-hydroxy-6-metoxy-1,4-benzoquinol methylase